MPVNSGLGGLKIVRAEKEGGRERVPNSRNHVDKRIIKLSGSAFLQFTAKKC